MAHMVRLGAVMALLGVALAQQLPDARNMPPAPVQPIPYSHKLHAGQLKIECTQCHTMPGDGDFATLPETAKCMTCHQTVKKESPEIAKLAVASAAGTPIEWKPVYKIADYVWFNHKKHVAVQGVTCESCHGQVKEREVLRREKDLSMQACMECHRAKGASADCTTCHEQR
jgi:hypothetical protein